jgi:phosphopantothenoylcysteine synthetase/decarboxylase
MKLLVTAGATREPIDRVRFITNLSTGRTGATIADQLAQLGHDVVYLYGEGSVLPKEKIKKIQFKDFRDLDQKIKFLVETEVFEAIIHLAAVSDYSVESILKDGETVHTQIGKLSSDGSLEIKLLPNYKILNRIKTYAAKKASPLVIGFKLTFTENEEEKVEAVSKLFQDNSVDFVVHNDLKEIEKQKDHKFHIYKEDHKLATCHGASDLAASLNKLFLEAI